MRRIGMAGSGMRRIGAMLALLLVAASTLAACGRSGPIRPAGPPEEITYPRTYPSR